MHALTLSALPPKIRSHEIQVIFFEFFLFIPFLQSQSCYLESDDVLRLQMSIIVTMGNSSKEFEENTQNLLDHLSIIYVATDKSETSGKVESFEISYFD